MTHDASARQTSANSAATAFDPTARRDVVVIGGGVVGAACAYYLQAAGRRVTIVEQGRFGGGCSHGNCGYVCPSHVLPLAGPGALRSTLKTLLARNSPLKVRWRFDPALWSWFFRFARRCNERDMLAAARAIQPLLTTSRTLYEELFRGPLTDVEWQTLGLLFVFESSAAMAHYAETDRLLREEFDLGAEAFDGDRLAEFEPGLRRGLGGAWHYATDGHLRPDKLMIAWRRACTTAGIEIVEHCELLDFDVAERQVRAARTSRGELRADQFVVATGAWTPRLRDLLRTSIPIQPGKGYSLTLPETEHPPRVPMIFEEHRVAITPFDRAYRIGSTMEFAGFDATMNPDRLQLLRDGAARYLRDPVPSTVQESWWGWRPMTPDGLPYLGRLPTLANAYLAAGHGMLGVSMAPATGRLLADLVCGRTPTLDPQPYAVDRRG